MCACVRAHALRRRAANIKMQLMPEHAHARTNTHTHTHTHMHRYFLRKLRRVKKANGQIVSVNEVGVCSRRAVCCVFVCAQPPSAPQLPAPQQGSTAAREGGAEKETGFSSRQARESEASSLPTCISTAS